MNITLDCFCLTVAVTIASAMELSVFIGVGGWVKPILWSVILRDTNGFPLWNSSPTYASATYTTTCLRILHSMWIGPFVGGRRFGDFFGSVGSELR